MFVSRLYVSLLVIFCLALSACGGGSGDSSGGSNNSNNNEMTSSVFSGSVGDGPIVGASITIYDNANNILDTTSSTTSANYQVNIRTGRKSFPLTFKASSGTDVVSNTAPDFSLRSIAMAPADKKNVNINPYSTFIVTTASQMQNGITETNLALATQYVLNALNFGLDTSLIIDPIGLELDETTIANFIKSTEVLSEMVRRSRSSLQSQNIPTTTDAIIIKISADLIDGVIDGKGANAADARVAATWNLLVADVGLEAMVNKLKVNGNVATTSLDNAIYTSLPDAPLGTTTAAVTINQKLIDMVTTSLQAAQTISTDTNLTDLESTLVSIPAGALPTEIETLLSAGQEQAVDNVITQLSSMSDPQVLAINETSSSNNTIPDNTSPQQVDTVVMVSSNADLSDAQQLQGATIGGNVIFYFQEGSDWQARGVSKVDFYCCKNASVAHVKYPSDSTSPYSINIDLSGYTTGETYELYADVFFNDQYAPEPFFAYFTVNNSDVSLPANFAPTISGDPTTSVVENTAYRFSPIANDSNGDSLTFNIQNKPTWADFNTNTGVLSGTPTSLNIGTFTNIIISVSDGYLTNSLPSFNIEVVPQPISQTGTATLNWLPPTEYTDNSPLTVLTGYKIYFGTSLGNYPNKIPVSNPGLTSFVVNNLIPGTTYYFVMTAIDGTGKESDFSNVIVRTAQ